MRRGLENEGFRACGALQRAVFAENLLNLLSSSAEKGEFWNSKKRKLPEIGLELAILADNSSLSTEISRGIRFRARKAPRTPKIEKFEKIDAIDP